MADSGADLDDWELLLGPEASEDEDLRPVVGEAPSDSDGDAIKIDYFDIDSDGLYRNRVAPGGNLQRFVVEDALIDLKLGNPSSDDCEFAGEMRMDKGLVSENDPRVFLPEGLVDVGNKEIVVDGIAEEEGEINMCSGNIHLLEEEVKVPQIESLNNDSEVISSCEMVDGQNEESGGSVVGDNFDGVAQEDEKEMDNSCTADSEESATADDKSTSNTLGNESEDVSSVEKSRIVWWKLPMEFIKFCAFRMKPMWSISVVAALLGAFVLTKKLYRIKQKNRTIPLKISFDKKKTSQLKIQAARLNEAFTIVRNVPVIRAPMLANNGSSSWPLVGFQ